MIRAPKGVRALFSDVNKVGKRIKASKKKYTWKFSIDSREHTVDMYVSSLSGKRKVLVDGDLRYNGKAQAGVYFQFPIKIERVMVVIEQMEDSWDLKIGGVSFAQLTTMRQGAPEAGEKSPNWGAQQEWKEQKDSEFGQVHNKWDDWDEKPKPKPAAVPNSWESREDRGPPKESWDREEDPWSGGRKDEWEERPARAKPASKPQQDYGWETKAYPGKREEDEDDDYPPKYERRTEDRLRDEHYRPERDDDRRYRTRDEEPRARPRDEEPRARPRDEEPRARPRDEEPRARPRDDDPRYRTRDEEPRARARDEDPWRARGRDDEFEGRHPPRRPSPRREDDFRETREPARRPPPRDEYERPKQEDPFGIHEPEPQVQRKPQYQDDYEDESLYPSLSSIDPRRQGGQSYPPAYQPAAATPSPPATDPFGAPLNFAPPSQPPSSYPSSVPDPFQAGNVFESKPASSSPFAPTPVEFKVSSSKPFEDDFFGGQSAPKKASEADLAGLVDLDGLNLGDDYSPAMMRKREEQNKAVSIGVAAPNVPMNQLKPSPDPRQMQTMPPMAANPMMPNPMAAAMMMQSYMTGMMMNSMMMNQGGQPPQPRYF